MLHEITDQVNWRCEERTGWTVFKKHSEFLAEINRSSRRLSTFCASNRTWKLLTGISLTLIQFMLRVRTTSSSHVAFIGKVSEIRCSFVRRPEMFRTVSSALIWETPHRTRSPVRGSGADRHRQVRTIPKTRHCDHRPVCLLQAEGIKDEVSSRTLRL